MDRRALITPVRWLPLPGFAGPVTLRTWPHQGALIDQNDLTFIIGTASALSRAAEQARSGPAVI